MNREIVECFKAYKKVKVDDYTMNYNGVEIVPHHVIYKKKDKGLYSHVPFLSDKEINEMQKKADVKPILVPHKGIIDKSLVDRLSPDNIDSRVFWKKATELYPLFCICGKKPEEPKEFTKEKINKINNDLASGSGAIAQLNEYLMDSPKSSFEMLEIGPGYGNICNITKSVKTVSINYHAIDVNPLFNHPRLYQTDGSTIPDEIPNNLDFVYSINVFQHLSKKQRSAYYKQIFNKLTIGGMFLFSMFVSTETNKDWPVWGIQDKKGRRYVGFFRQFTEVDFYEELKEELESVGFEFNNVSLHEDKSHSLLFKCIKK